LVRRTARTLATSFLATTAFAMLSATVAQAQIEWKPCVDSNDVACGHLTVPLDPSGGTQGTITLAMRRHRSPVGESKDAVIALAGGPGQSAIPFIAQFAEVLGPIVATRDLIAFDQRGTGLSHPLSCAAFEHLKNALSPAAVAICAGQIGETRGLYTTADTVADIEAIRQAGGYEKLVLYGTSYGTKVAERYAQEHPSHVEALVLDSVVPPNGPEAFNETTFKAVDRILRQLCSGGDCAHVTHNPVSDLARVVKRMGGGSLRGRVIDDEGEAETMRISANDLLGILLEGDFDPILRAEFPAAIRSAVSGDTAALARLVARAQGGEEGEESLSEGFDTSLYYSTICDETVFPWKRTSTPGARLREAAASLRAQAANVFAPFGFANAIALSDIPTCAYWPLTPGGPEVDEAPLPNVPTLILSGADDLRTPIANAKLVAAQIPDANLLVVPNTGHSVLGSDPTSCAHNALQAFFEQKPVRSCKHKKPPTLLLPTPLPPHTIAAIPPAPGSHGRVGRTLDAVLRTLGDFNRQVILAILEHAGGTSLFGGLPSVRVGGLRAGWGGTLHEDLVLHGYSYVPGVSVSGRTSPNGGGLRVSGSSAVHGTIRITAHGTLTGSLGGRPVHLKPPKSMQLAANGSSVVPTRLSALLAISACTPSPVGPSICR
jgi:pimeloyl-ACP methyl ester carboxylesterase